MDGFILLNNYGWIFVLVSIIKITYDMLKIKKYYNKYEWTIFNKIAIVLIFFMLTFQVGEFFPINPEFQVPAKKFLVMKDPMNAKIIYYGPVKNRSGSCYISFLYDKSLQALDKHKDGTKNDIQ